MAFFEGDLFGFGIVLQVEGFPDAFVEAPPVEVAKVPYADWVGIF